MGYAYPAKSKSATETKKEKEHMMQQVRLETKSRDLVADIEMPIFSVDEPDVIVWGDRVFVRRPPFQTEPPKKNDPETYFEAFTYHIPATTITAPAPKFDKVTETIPSTAKATEPPAATSRRGATKD
jgi:hypothetical protein